VMKTIRAACIVLGACFVSAGLCLFSDGEARAVKNLAANNSFELFKDSEVEGARNDDEPDKFLNWDTVAVEHRVINLYAERNDKTEYGKTYVKVKGLAGAGARVEQIVDLDEPIGNKSYTFSVWAKAGSGAEGAHIYFSDGVSQGADPEYLKLSAEWQRYSVSKTFASSASRKICLYFGPSPHAVQTFYIDAVQLEEGTEASPVVEVSSDDDADGQAEKTVVKLKFRQGDLGKRLSGKNMYLLDETVVMKVLRGTTSAKKTVSIEYRITDWHGRTLEKGSKGVELAPDYSSSPQPEIRYRPSLNGVFYVSYCVNDNGKRGVDSKVSFSVVPPEPAVEARPEESPFGIVYSLPDMMPLVGSKWHRVDFPWFSVEPTEGNLNWGSLDGHVAAADKYHYRVFPVLDYPPPWASTAPDDVPEGEKWRHVPKLEDYSRYVTNVVSRYKDKIKYWEIYGETDCPAVFRGGSPGYYANMLKTAKTAAMTADPDSKIVGFGSSPKSLAYLEETFKLGGLKYIDVFSIHPYRIPLVGSLEETDFWGETLTLRKLVDRYGGKHIPFWFTEYVWQADDLDPNSAKFLRKDEIVTEREQADYLAQIHIEGLSLGGERFFWFTMRHPNNSLAEIPDAGAGLLRPDYTAKPSFLAYRTLSDLLTGVVPVRHKRIGSLKAHTFLRNGKEITAVWDADGPQVAALKIPGKQITRIDLMGNSKSISVDKDPYVMAVDGSPVFLEGADITLLGGVATVEWGKEDILSLKETERVKVSLSNPTGRKLSGTVSINSPDFVAKPGEIGFSLEKNDTREVEIRVSVKDRQTAGRKTLRLAVDLGQPYPAILREKIILISPYSEAVFAESFEKDVSSWGTNANEKHVEYNTIEKSDKYARDGRYSLKWRCKSFLWNNAFYDMGDAVFKDAKAIEFWVYLEKPYIGQSQVSIEILQKSGVKFGYWGKLRLPAPGKWQRYIVFTEDFSRAMASAPDPTATLTLDTPFAIWFNYTNGEMEAYVDNVRLLK